ncbi:MAG: hypothetical protein ACK5LJ_00565 [Paracoccus sp. (in: a-proteobacteria)]
MARSDEFRRGALHGTLIGAGVLVAVALFIPVHRQGEPDRIDTGENPPSETVPLPEDAASGGERPASKPAPVIIAADPVPGPDQPAMADADRTPGISGEDASGDLIHMAPPAGSEFARAEDLPPRLPGTGSGPGGSALAAAPAVFAPQVETAPRPSIGSVSRPAIPSSTDHPAPDSAADTAPEIAALSAPDIPAAEMALPGGSRAPAQLTAPVPDSFSVTDVIHLLDAAVAEGEAEIQDAPAMDERDVGSGPTVLTINDLVPADPSDAFGAPAEDDLPADLEGGIAEEGGALPELPSLLDPDDEAALARMEADASSRPGQRKLPPLPPLRTTLRSSWEGASDITTAQPGGDAEDQADALVVMDQIAGQAPVSTQPAPDLEIPSIPGLGGF